MQIAILGGSFDPPHLGHLLISQQIKKHLNVDQVWLMACFQHPFAKKLTNPKHRLAMTKLLESESIRASDFEIKQGKINYTIDTIRELKKHYPNDTFYWIIGSDQLAKFKKWKEWQEILTYPLIVYAREQKPEELENYIKQALNLPEIPQKMFLLKEQNLLTSNISSTKIRERVKQRLPIKTLVPKKVEKYIIEHNLYK